MRKLKNEELGRKSVEEFKTAEKAPLIIVLDNVRSLNNIGSVFRTADAFLLEGIYLCGITATPPHREIHKTASVVLQIPLHGNILMKQADAIHELKNDQAIRLLPLSRQSKASPWTHSFQTQIRSTPSFSVMRLQELVMRLCP